MIGIHSLTWFQFHALRSPCHEVPHIGEPDPAELVKNPFRRDLCLFRCLFLDLLEIRLAAGPTMWSEQWRISQERRLMSRKRFDLFWTIKSAAAGLPIPSVANRTSFQRRDETLRRIGDVCGPRSWPVNSYYPCTTLGGLAVSSSGRRPTGRRYGGGVEIVAQQRSWSLVFHAHRLTRT